jgi:hypothetical protein
VGRLNGGISEVLLLITQHARNKLPGRTRRFAPWSRYCDSAVSVLSRIEVDKLAGWRKHRLPVLVREEPDFHQSALNGNFGSAQQSGRCNEIEFVRIAQTDPPFQGLFHFAEKIRTGSFDFITDALMDVWAKQFSAKASRRCAAPLRNPVPTRSSRRKIHSEDLA